MEVVTLVEAALPVGVILVEAPVPAVETQVVGAVLGAEVAIQVLAAHPLATMEDHLHLHLQAQMIR